MKKHTVVNNMIYYCFCGFSGAVIAGIVWLFLKLMGLGIDLIWETIPSAIDFKYYTLAVCTIGGILIGVYQKFANAIPEELDTVMAKVKRDKFYPYNKVVLLCIAALLPLIFGGSIGPEAGLTGVIVGLCYWAGNHMKSAKSRIPELMETGVSATLCAIFYAPIFGLFAAKEERLDEKEGSSDIRSNKIVSNIVAVLCATGTIFLLNSIFGGSSQLPRIGEYNITNTERLLGLPMALLGVVAGFIFIVSGKILKKIFDKIQSGLGFIVSSTIGGITLGILGTILPLVMFSGEESMAELGADASGYAPWILIIAGVVKLIVTNVCIESGWKGGHFFPVIFCGVSIGFGFGMLFGLSTSFCAAVITAALLGATMKKPLAVTFLLLLCFDVRIIPWILLAALLGSIVSAKILPEKKAENRIEAVKESA